MHPRRLALVGAALLLALAATPAPADLPRPACEALARWAAEHDRNAGWTPNALRPPARAKFNALFAAPATATLFGRPVLEWTPEEARALAPHLQSCADQLRRARAGAATALGQLRTQLQREVPNYLAELAAARAAAPARIAELAAAEPSLALLRLHRALADLATEPEAGPHALQATRALPAAQRPAATALLDALRDLPEPELAPLLAGIAPRIPALQAALADSLIAEAGSIPATQAGLQRLARERDRTLAEHAPELGPDQAARVEAALAAREAAIGQALTQELLDRIAAVPAAMLGAPMLDRLQSDAAGRAEAIGEAGLRAVEAAIATRRAAIGQAVLAELLQAIAAAPATPAGLAEMHRLETDAAPPQLIQLILPEGVARMRAEAARRRAAISAELTAALVQRAGAIPADLGGFAALDAVATPQTLAALRPAEAAQVSAALAARRRAITEAALAEFRRALAALPLTDEGLGRIEDTMQPALDALPRSAAAERARLAVVVQERRAAILAAVNRAEAGPLRGRIYENEALRLEFAAGGRAVVTLPGAPPAGGTYTEDPEGRVFLEVNGQSLVFLREGRRLVAGPMLLTRMQ
jgi:hypothetical protein